MLKRTLISALEAGGAIIKRGFPRDKIIVERKGPTSLVTQIDKASEKAILSLILKRFPGHGIVSEESPVKISTEPYRWFIDPLDGTTNFIHGVPLVSVSIGVEYRERMILGGVYNPIANEMFLAEKGHGARLNGKPIHVSQRVPAGGFLVCDRFSLRPDSSSRPIMSDFSRRFLRWVRASDGSDRRRLTWPGSRRAVLRVFGSLS